MSERHFALPLSRRAARACLVSLSLAFLSLFVLPTTADAGGQGHPYFNDRGTLNWHTRYASARREAQREGKLIFVEAGRKKCPLCNKLCRDVLPSRAIRGRIAKIAVGLAAEVDRPEAACSAIIRSRFARARKLPLVWFMTPDGRYVTGFWGGRSVQQFARDLDCAEAAWRRMNRSTCAPRRASPVTPKPVTPKPMTPKPSTPAPIAVEPPACEAAPLAAAGDLGDDDCCKDGSCDFRPAAPAIPDFLGSDPCAKPSSPATEAPAPVTAANGFPKSSEPFEPRNGPAPRANAVRASGTPDGEPPAGIVARPGTTLIRPAARSGNTIQKAQEAAARGQWGRVLSTIGKDAGRDPALLRLAREAHQWAHERLEAAVRHLGAGRTADARRALEDVQDQMAGQTEEADVRRGLEAIEFVEDLAFLSESSAVRRAVRRSAYERLRGSRWAQLFRE